MCPEHRERNVQLRRSARLLPDRLRFELHRQVSSAISSVRSSALRSVRLLGSKLRSGRCASKLRHGLFQPGGQ
jgi:hypothetical protein